MYDVTVASQQPDVLQAKLLSAVAALTRDLSPGELSIRVTTREELPVHILVHYTASFTAQTATGHGSLPSGITAFPTPAHMRQELQQRLPQVVAEAGGLLDAWAAHDASDYRTALPPDRCMHPRPRLGSQEVCTTCHGAKELGCVPCAGAGQVTCTRCGGRGRVTCSSCGGSGSSMCMACGGTGGSTETYYETQWDGQKNVQVSGTRRVPCGACGASGRNRCGCDNGTQVCGCNNGRVICGGCGGRGIVSCATCGATGIVHHIGWVACAVQRTTYVDIESAYDEDRATFRERVAFDRVAEMTSVGGRVGRTEIERAGNDLTLRYSGSIPVERADATVGGHTSAISAYGREREIFNYQEIAGRLLEPDLVDVETTVQGTRFFDVGAKATLAAAAKKLLASELHALVAEAPSPAASSTDGSTTSTPRVRYDTLAADALLLKAAGRRFLRGGVIFKIVSGLIALRILLSPAWLFAYVVAVVSCALVERRAQESAAAPSPHVHLDSLPPDDRAAILVNRAITDRMVSAAYVRRASAVIATATPRLYGPLVLPMTAALAVGLIALFFAVNRIFLEYDVVERSLVPAAVTIASAIAIEWRASNELKTILGENLYGRLEGRFEQTRDRYRLAAAAAFAFAFLLTALL